MNVFIGNFKLIDVTVCNFIYRIYMQKLDRAFSYNCSPLQCSVQVLIEHITVLLV